MVAVVVGVKYSKFALAYMYVVFLFEDVAIHAQLQRVVIETCVGDV